MRKPLIANICVLSIVASIVTFALAHITFGVNYVLHYFITVFLVSIIPMWTIVYIVLRHIYSHYYYSCIIKIFDTKTDKNITKRIFGVNFVNISITISIALFIFSCYVYFGENSIIVMPEKFEMRIYCYCLGIIPILCGSFSGAIYFRIISEAWNFLKNKINEKNISNYIINLRKLKIFLNISIVSAYTMCFIMYVAVLLGPHEEEQIQQPLIFFLVFLILWPLIIHIFCRIYLELVREKCLEERFKDINSATSDEIQEEIRKRKNMMKLFGGYNDKYKSLSLFFSLLLSISQIVVVFLR